MWTFTTTKNTRLPRPTFRKSTSLPPITYYDRDDNSTEVNATTPNPQMGEAAVSVPVITVTVAVPTSFMFLGGCFLYAQYRRGRGLIYGCLNRRQRYQTSPPPSPAHSTQTVVNITDDEENTEYELHHRNITTTIWMELLWRMKFPFKTWDPTLVLYILWHRETAHCIPIYWYPVPTILRPVPGIPIQSA